MKENDQVSARRPSPAVWVTGLLVGSLAVVTGLTVQARSGPTVAGTSEKTATAKPSPSATPSSSAREETQPDVPADSGTGRRVVYSLGQDRVWLVDADTDTDTDDVRRSFNVWPGTVDPAEGTYTVSFRREEGTGSDGVKIENAVYFSTASAFSNALDGASPSPDPNLRTGAIRERVADGEAMWEFATSGTAIVVVK